jgi:UDP-glucose 4-epimerase
LGGTTDQVGAAFNAGTGRSVSIRELAELVKAATGSSSEIRHTDPREGDIDHSRADIGKARSRLGYRPRIELEAGLRTIDDVSAEAPAAADD